MKVEEGRIARARGVPKLSMRIAAVLSVLNCRLTLDCGQQRALALGLFPNDPHGGEENERLRNSSVEITKLVGDMHPLAFTGDPGEIGLSTARVVDALGGMRGDERWWSQSGSNRRPDACKATALPAELWPQSAIASVFGNRRLRQPTNGGPGTTRTSDLTLIRGAL